ncbi:MAG: hypothetical protein IJR81_04915 [Clostridia bacterium]|nr:hypothetical protein [Clostridia bacterium]
MDKWFGPDASEQPMLGLSRPEKLHLLFMKQKETLDLFLERGAISQDQHDKNLNILRNAMGRFV